MSTVRDLKRRIKSITSTQQMTQAMKMVSVSKYNRAQSGLEAFRLYREQCNRLMEAAGGVDPTVLECSVSEPTGTVSRLYVVLTGNRGLCGSYNQDIIRYLKDILEQASEHDVIWMCGKWGIENAHGIKTSKTFVFSDVPSWDESNQLTEKLISMYISGEVQEIYFVYQQFKNVLTQIPVCSRFLPMERNVSALSDDYIFEPNQRELRKTLIECSLKADVYEILLNASTGVHSAMMISMRTASDNSEAMIEDLSLQMNRLRQSAVTTQVLEISGSSMQEGNL